VRAEWPSKQSLRVDRLVLIEPDLPRGHLAELHVQFRRLLKENDLLDPESVSFNACSIQMKSRLLTAKN